MGKEGDFRERQLVIFRIADEEFGVDINEVKEIIRYEEITNIPSTEPYIHGVINLRGKLVVIADLAMKLGFPSKEVDDDTRILIVDINDNSVGMIVDSSSDVLTLNYDEIKDIPSMATSRIDANYIKGLGILNENRLLTLLDLSKVLDVKDYENIEQTQKTVKNNMVG